MKLYYHPASTTSRPLMLFAADNSVELDYQNVDLFTGEHTQSVFTAINPNQAVPVLEDGDFRLTESSAILKYLADKVGSPAYPTDLRRRSRVNERMDWFNTTLSRELCYGFVYPQVLPHHKRSDHHLHGGLLAWHRPNVLRWLQVLDEKWIGPDNRYVCGNEITLADYLGVAMITLGEAVRIDYSRWPNVYGWIGRMKDRPSWDSVNEIFYRAFVQPYAEIRFEAL
jgi:glutathione S-transferase